MICRKELVMLSGRIASMYDKVQESMDQCYIVHLSRQERETKDLFLSREYYKFQYEESLDHVSSLTKEIKFLQISLRERKNNQQKDVERLLQRYESELADLKAENEVGEKMRRLLREELNISLRNEDELKKIIEEQDSSLKIGTVQLKVAQKENEVLTKELDEKERSLSETRVLLESSVARYVDEVKRSEDEVGRLKTENECLRSSLKGKDVFIEQNEEAKKNLTKLKMELGLEKSNSKFELHQLNVEHDRKLIEMDKQLEQKETMIRQKDDNLTKLRHELAEVNAKLEFHQTPSNSPNNREVAEMHEKLEQKERKIRQKDKYLENQREELAELNAKIELHQLNSPDNKLIEINEKLEQKEKKIQQKDTYLANLREELAEVNAKLDDKTKMTSFLYERVKRVESIASQRNSYKDKCDQLEHGQENLNKKVSKLKEENNILRKKLKDVGKSEDLHKEVKLLKEENKTLEKKLNQVGETGDQQQKIKELEDRIKDLQDEKVERTEEDQKQQLTELNDRIKDLLREKEKLKEVQQKFQNEIDISSSECENLSKQTSTLQTSVEKLQQELKEQERASEVELTEMRKQLQYANIKSNSLIIELESYKKG